MSGVETDLEGMIAFRSRLVSFDTLLQEEFSSLRAGWAELGEVWRDDKYRELGAALDELFPGIERYLAVTEEHETHLLRLIEITRAYLDARF